MMSSFYECIARENKELKANIADITQIKEICKEELISFATDIYSNDVE